MTPAELARCAAAKIKELGLAKHVLQDSERRVCLRGALNLCETGDAFDWSNGSRTEVERTALLCPKVLDYIDAEGWRFTLRGEPSPREAATADPHRYVEAVIDFNNDEDTTAEDVIEVLEWAATQFEGAATAA